MQRGEFRVSVARDDLVFSSAHFITYAPHRCEGLHGHNYRARVTVDGELDPRRRARLRFPRAQAHHAASLGRDRSSRLLPLESARIRVIEDGETVRVSVDDTPRYVFPRGDCALLPVPNTTVEMLGEPLATRLQRKLVRLGVRGLTAIENGNRGELRAIRDTPKVVEVALMSKDTPYTDAQIATQLDGLPGWSQVTYRRVGVALATHSAGGITAKDFRARPQIR